MVIKMNHGYGNDFFVLWLDFSTVALMEVLNTM